MTLKQLPTSSLSVFRIDKPDLPTLQSPERQAPACLTHGNSMKFSTEFNTCRHCDPNTQPLEEEMEVEVPAHHLHHSLMGKAFILEVGDVGSSASSASGFQTHISRLPGECFSLQATK